MFRGLLAAAVVSGLAAVCCGLSCWRRINRLSLSAGQGPAMGMIYGFWLTIVLLLAAGLAWLVGL